MADIATLGISTEVSGVEKGTVALNNLATSAKRAEVATDGVTRATKNASAASAAANSNVTSSTNAVTTAVKSQASAIDAAGAAVSRAKIQWESGEAAAARLGLTSKKSAESSADYVAGLRAQVAAEKAAAAAADVTNTSLGAVDKSTKTATVSFGLFGAVLRTVSTILGGFLLNALSTALGVLIAQLGQFVDWGGLAASALNGLAWAIETIGPYAVGAAAALALIYAPSLLAGLWAVTVAITGLSAAAIRAAAAFTVAWLAAIGPAGWFVLGLAAVTIAAIAFRDDLTQIFGFDIVGAAKGGINTIIAAFHAGYDGVVASWDNLPAAFGDLGYQAANKFIEAINWMVGEVVSLINGLIAKINGGLRGAIGALGGDAANAIQLKDLGSPQSFKMGGINNPYAGSAAGVGSNVGAAFAKHRNTDYLGDLGTSISDGASSAADKLRDWANGFGEVGDAAGGAGGAAGKAAKDATDPWKALRDTASQTSSAFMDAGKSAGGILKGLVSGTMSWKDALQQALSVALKLMTQLQPNMFGGGFLQGVLGGLFGFASGGYTGSGPAHKAAGVVHGGEYVFSKSATDRIGVGRLEGMHRAAKGYATGGYVGHAGSRADRAANDQPLKLDIVSRFDADGGFESAVERTSRPIAQKESVEAAGRVAKSVPSMVDSRTDERQTRKVRAGGMF